MNIVTTNYSNRRRFDVANGDYEVTPEGVYYTGVLGFPALSFGGGGAGFDYTPHLADAYEPEIDDYGRPGRPGKNDRVDALRRRQADAARAEAQRLLDAGSENAEEIAAIVGSGGRFFDLGLDLRDHVTLDDGYSEDGYTGEGSYDDSDRFDAIARANLDDEGITDVRSLRHHEGAGKGLHVEAFEAHVARTAKARRFHGIEDTVFDKRGRVRGGASGKTRKPTGKPTRAERVAAIRARRAR